MEVLSLAVCKTILSNPSASPTPQEFEKILDSVTVHIQDSHIQVNAEEVAVIVDALKEPIKSLFSKVDTLEKELKDLQRKYENLQKKYRELEELQSTLLVGQIASQVEKKLLKRILHGTDKYRAYQEGTDVSLEYATFNKIQDAISGRSEGYRTGIHLTVEDRAIAGANWDRMDGELQLDKKFYLSHDDFKKYRNNKAHPKLDHNNIQTCLAQLEGNDRIQLEKMIKVIKNDN